MERVIKARNIVNEIKSLLDDININGDPMRIKERKLQEKFNQININLENVLTEHPIIFSIDLYVDGAGGLFKNEIRGKSKIRLFSYDIKIDDNEKEFIIEDSTNNEAELKAILYGIEFLRRKRIDKANIYSDSELCVDVINKKKKLKAENLIPILDKIRTVLSKDSNYQIKWIPEEQQLAHKK